MALFRIPGGVASQVRARPSHPGKEKGLQTLIENNLDTLFGVRFVATEFSTGSKHRGRIDTLGLDQDGSPVIIEYKLTSNDNVINQGLFYLDWLMDHRGDFEVKVRSTLGDVPTVWDSPRLILLASSFNRFDQYAVNRIDERIELWTYTLYEDDLLGIELLSSEEVSTSTGNATIKRPTPKAQAPGRPTRSVYEREHHVSKMSGSTEVLFELLRDEIMKLGDDVTERFMNQYIGYRRLKNFCEIVGMKSKLNVFIDGPIANPKGLGDDVSNIGHWGTGQRRIEVADEDDVVAALPLIANAYGLQG